MRYRFGLLRPNYRHQIRLDFLTREGSAAKPEWNEKGVEPEKFGSVCVSDFAKIREKDHLSKFRRAGAVGDRSLNS